MVSINPFTSTGYSSGIVTVFLKVCSLQVNYTSLSDTMNPLYTEHISRTPLRNSWTGTMMTKCMLQNPDRMFHLMSLYCKHHSPEDFMRQKDSEIRSLVKMYQRAEDRLDNAD